MNKVVHKRQPDTSLDRELREIIEVLNQLVEKLAIPSTSLPSDVGKQMIQAVALANNLYSIAVQTVDGFSYSLPGIFQKIGTIPDIGTLGQVVAIKADGNAGWTDPTNVTGLVNSVTATAPVVSTAGANPVISMAKASGSVNGYLSSTDWTTFNNKMGTANVPGIRSGTTALTAGVTAVITYSTGLSGTVNAISLSCKDADGAEVEVTISGATGTHFHAVSPVDATLIWIAVKEL